MLASAFFDKSSDVSNAACLLVAGAIDLNDIPYAEGVRFSGTSRCLPGTREGILDRIQTLLSGVADEDIPRIVLLTGVAGYGKSAVASTIAERLEERQRLGSSFFFNRNKDNQNRVDNVFTTIARDIADGNPEIREILWSIVKDSRSLRKTTDVREQFTRFILNPAKQVTTIGPIVIVIDGFDECGNPTSRTQLIDVLAKELSDLPSNFRILLTARPEEDIIRGLASLPCVRHIRMESIDKTSTAADLTAFVTKELSSIGNEFEREWPQMIWREELVKKADELFIWISTACLFIKNKGRGGTNYRKRLKLILSGSSQSRVLAPLDELYLRVLRNAFEEQDIDAISSFKSVVGKILALKVPLSADALSDFLEAEESVSHEDARSDIQSVVSYLGSVLIGTTEWNTPLQILHLSFRDFLTEPSRSAAFFIDMKEQTKSMATLCLDIMHQHLKRDICEIRDSVAPNPEIEEVRQRMAKFETLQYVCRYWVDHVIDFGSCEKSLSDRIWAFFSCNALHWIEALSLTDQLGYGIGSLDRLETCLKVPINLIRLHMKLMLTRLIWNQKMFNDERITEMIRDEKRLLLAFGRLITSHALQIYDSAVVFAPHGTTLLKHYTRQNQPICTVLNARSNWSPLLCTLNGHADWVSGICFSPDGTRLASCSYDNTVRLWDAHTGSAIGDAMVGHTAWIHSICFSPDGTRLASCSRDTTVRLWNAYTSTAIGDATVGHTDWINSICFSPNSTRLASCSNDTTVRLWDAHTGSAIGDAMVGHADSIKSICFSPDGTRLASCSDDATVRLWDVHTSSAIGEAMVGHSNWINSVCFSPDGTRLASCSDDNTVRLWDAHTSTTVGDAMVGHTNSINSICFSPDGTRLASCSYDTTVRLWDAHTGSAIGDAMVGHANSINSICFSPDGTRLASCSGDATVRLWDAHTGRAIGDAMVGHTNWITSICFSPDGARLASCSRDKTVRLWDAHTSTAIRDAMVGHADLINSICFSPDGTHLASCSNDTTVRLWDVHAGRAIGDAMVGHTDWIKSICFSPDGTRLASCSYDATVRLWDVHTSSAIGEAMVGHTNWIDSICFSPDGTRLASCSRDATVRLWDACTGSALGDAMVGHTSLVLSIRFSPDGTRLASCSGDKALGCAHKQCNRRCHGWSYQLDQFHLLLTR
jgi:WD40 repeat protein